MTETVSESTDSGAPSGDYSDLSPNLEKRRKFSWRPNALMNLVNPTKRKKSTSASVTSTVSEYPDEFSTTGSFRNSFKSSSLNGSFRKGRDWNTIVNVILIEAKGLPEPPPDGSSHGIYSKLRLGVETYKSKTVQNTRQPKWRQKFKFHLQRHYLLKLSLWDKGSKKNFMGSCTIDLTSLELEKTHEQWHQLEDGFGSILFSVTMCKVRNLDLNGELQIERPLYPRDTRYAWFNMNGDWDCIGQLTVKVLCAKGLFGRPSAYCILEVGNERIQTHSTPSSTEPLWNKTYVFNVYDVVSTLDIKVQDSSIVNLIQGDFLGRLSIPIFRIQNGVPKWYALKDKNKKNVARGNCPRLLIEMNLVWNPVKAAARAFRPNEIKYLKKPEKFDLGLVYNNIVFIRETFDNLVKINDFYKRLFEWENREFSLVFLLLWLFFWFFFEVWMAPLLILLPFFYFWIFYKKYDRDTAGYYDDIEDEESPQSTPKVEKSITGQIKGLPEMTLIITDGIDYIHSLVDRIINLASFKVPFLSYVAMVGMVGAAFVLYFVPFKYLAMGFGLMKFTRKMMNPDRVLNNDILDFIFHVPDSDILKEWKELSVPEPKITRRLSTTSTDSVEHATSGPSRSSSLRRHLSPLTPGTPRTPLTPNSPWTPMTSSAPSTPMTPRSPLTPSSPMTPSLSRTPSSTMTPSLSRTPSSTMTPSLSRTPSSTMTPSSPSIPTAAPRAAMTPDSPKTPKSIKLQDNALTAAVESKIASTVTEDSCQTSKDLDNKI